MKKLKHYLGIFFVELGKLILTWESIIAIFIVLAGYCSQYGNFTTGLISANIIFFLLYILYQKIKKSPLISKKSMTILIYIILLNVFLVWVLAQFETNDVAHDHQLESRHCFECGPMLSDDSIGD